jgi:hypothetical protein
LKKADKLSSFNLPNASRLWFPKLFGNLDALHKAMFEVRHEKPDIIMAKLEIPKFFWNQQEVPVRDIRRWRGEAIGRMTELRLEKDPDATLDELWDEWDLKEVPQWDKKDYEKIFENAKRETELRKNRERHIVKPKKTGDIPVSVEHSKDITEA